MCTSTSAIASGSTNATSQPDDTQPMGSSSTRVTVSCVQWNAIAMRSAPSIGIRRAATSARPNKPSWSTYTTASFPAGTGVKAPVSDPAIVRRIQRPDSMTTPIAGKRAVVRSVATTSPVPSRRFVHMYPRRASSSGIAS